MQKLIAGLLVLVVALLSLISFQGFQAGNAPQFGSQYQAVVLNNGQVYFGRLENAASQYPIMRDVFYIVSQVNPETKQVANVLVRRGQELHGPEFMILNRQSILMIEPVKEDSQVAKFIAEQKK
jgi:hypothetical protein